jgi:hypothetical protein
LVLLAGVTIVVTAIVLRAGGSQGADANPRDTAASPEGAPRAGPPSAASASLPQRRQRGRATPKPSMVEGARPVTTSDAEDALMMKLRSLAGQDPQQIIRLAREANARDPDGPNAPERAWMIVKSLTDQQRFSEAKDEAQTMVNRYPGTSWALDAQRHLLSNPL